MPIFQKLIQKLKENKKRSIILLSLFIVLILIFSGFKITNVPSRYVGVNSANNRTLDEGFHITRGSVQLYPKFILIFSLTRSLTEDSPMNEEVSFISNGRNYTADISFQLKVSDPVLLDQTYHKPLWSVAHKFIKDEIASEISKLGVNMTESELYNSLSDEVLTELQPKLNSVGINLINLSITELRGPE